MVGDSSGASTRKEAMQLKLKGILKLLKAIIVASYQVGKADEVMWSTRRAVLKVLQWMCRLLFIRTMSFSWRALNSLTDLIDNFLQAGRHGNRRNASKRAGFGS